MLEVSWDIEGGWLVLGGLFMISEPVCSREGSYLI